MYIEESLGTLFVVVRSGVGLRYIMDDSERIPLTLAQNGIFDDLDEELTYGTTNIRVFEVDLVTCKLAETKELGDRAFFIDHNASRSVQPCKFSESSQIIFILRMIIGKHTLFLKKAVAWTWVFST